jgi:hypothetical protein
MKKKAQTIEVVEAEPVVEPESEALAEPVVLSEPEIRHLLYTLEFHDSQIGRLQKSITEIEKERDKPGGHLPDQLVRFEQQINQAQAAIDGQYLQIAGVEDVLQSQGRLPSEGTRENRRTELSGRIGSVYGGKQQS